MGEFGRSMLGQWRLDPEVTYLNHGTVGATPRRVLAKQQEIRDEIERQPSQFLLRELTGIVVGMPRPAAPRLRAAASEVAPFVGARSDDFVFVENATTGINAVLRSLDLSEGDEVLVTDHVYGAVARTAAFVTRRIGAGVRSVELPYPVSSPDQLVAAIVDAIGPRTRILVLEHVTSESALVLPVLEIAARSRSAGVPVLVDGAHAPGALPLDIPSLGVDWYSANLHKWAFSPRPAGFLWAAPERHANLHPPVISWGLDQGLSAEFDLTGTRDPSPFLAAPEGIAFMRDLGVDAVRGYNHRLAWEAARLLSRRWGTTIGMSEEMVGTMATIPLPERMGSTIEDANQLRDALLFEDRIEIQLHAWRDRLWVRVSAQVYNDLADVERLAAAVDRR